MSNYRLFFVCLITIILNLSGVTFAGHPLRSDDSYNIGSRNFQFEYLTEFQWSGGNHSVVWPFALSYGLQDNADVIIETPICNNFSERKEYLLNEISIRVKYSIISSESFAMAVKPGIILPTNKIIRNLTNGTTNYSVSLINSYSTSSVRLHLNNSLCSESSESRAKIFHWEISVGTELDITGKMTGVFDFGTKRELTANPDAYSSYLLSGIIYQVTENIAFDIGMVYQANKSDHETGLLTGVTFVF